MTDVEIWSIVNYLRSIAVKSAAANGPPKGGPYVTHAQCVKP